jgi:hypothetical protein
MQPLAAGVFWEEDRAAVDDGLGHVRLGDPVIRQARRHARQVNCAQRERQKQQPDGAARTEPGYSSKGRLFHRRFIHHEDTKTPVLH